MPFDIIGFGEAAPGANANLAALLSDTLYRTSGDDLYVKAQAPYLLGVWTAQESTGEGVTLAQPSLALDYNIGACALLSSDDQAVGLQDFKARPLPLVAGEKLNCTVVNATDEDGICALFVGSGRITQASLDSVNPTHIIGGHADTTLTAFTWGALSMTWDQSLPAGRYVPVGMRFSYFKSSVAMPAIARLTFKEPQAAAWRPGVIGHEAQADHEEDQTSRPYPFDIWPFMNILSFPHDQMPGVEACSAEATTDENVQLLLQKVS